jgi:hypothetical protein
MNCGGTSKGSNLKRKKFHSFVMAGHQLIWPITKQNGSKAFLTVPK